MLDTVNLEDGTYVGTRLLVSSIGVEVDINRDGDTLDKNVEIILTEEEFNSLPSNEKPSVPQTKPTAPDKPVAPDKPSEPSEPEESSQPPEPTAPSEPEPCYKIVNGLVYMGWM